MDKLVTGFEAYYGYSPGDNKVSRRTEELSSKEVDELVSRGASSGLIPFYHSVADVSLPAVGNAWFIDSADEVIRSAQSGLLPSKVAGALSGRIVVFGTDGGGGLLTVVAGDERVYRLNGCFDIDSFDVDDSDVQVVSKDFGSFVEMLEVCLADTIAPIGS
ncbi:hypothetical protein [Actinokineospora diospyrosa]|uniref:hypothetical protein n=1 Tax=Actinokineospora diospyrosa TaxID=103728 RepID=UPI0031D27888